MVCRVFLNPVFGTSGARILNLDIHINSYGGLYMDSIQPRHIGDLEKVLLQLRGQSTSAQGLARIPEFLLLRNIYRVTVVKHSIV